MENNRVDVTGILETRVKENKGQNISRKIGVEWAYCCNHLVASNVRIWQLLRNTTQVQIKMILEQFIHCNISDQASRFQSYCIVVYAKNGQAHIEFL